jgi:hypothetical protein
LYLLWIYPIPQFQEHFLQYSNIVVAALSFLLIDLLSFSFCISFIGASIETKLSESSTAVSRGLNAANTTLKKEIIIMTNYRQTEAIYKNANYPYKKPLEQLDFESWTKKVTDE